MHYKQKISNAFNRAVKDYDSVATVQYDCGRHLMALAQAHLPTQIGCALDIGCGSGKLTRVLQQVYNPTTLIGLDIAEQMARQTQAMSIPAVCADLEQLPIQSQSCEMVFSNFTLQWCADLSIFFRQIKQILKSSGYLLFTTLGTQSLQELRNSWALIDDYQHVNTFHDITHVVEQLYHTGFDVVIQERHIKLSHFSSLYALMLHLKTMGASQVMGRQRRGLMSRHRWQKLQNHYESYRQTLGLPMTFEVIFILAKSESHV